MQTADYPDIPPDFGHWLAGFIDGEGSFDIRPTNGGRTYGCRLAIKLRADDRAILDEIQQRTGLGKVYFQRPSRSQPNAKLQAGWHVYARDDLRRLLELLDRYPLRAKKARDYAIWRPVCLHYVTRQPRFDPHRPMDWSMFAEGHAELRRVRAYSGPAMQEIPPAADPPPALFG